MSEPVFLRVSSGLTVGEIATLTGANTADGTTLDRRIVNIAPLDRAGAADLTFCDNSRYLEQLEATRACACLTTERYASLVPKDVIALPVKNPFKAFVSVGRVLFPQALRPSSLYEGKTVEGAVVHPAARLEAGVTVDPGAVIGPRAEIGSGTVIAANAVVGPDVRIGRDCAIGSSCTVTHAIIGDRVIIHPGCQIGQDGFGFVMGPKGHEKVPQVGRVIIQNDVEIGACTAVDRGAIRDTVIGEGTKIDNLVQVGHNVSIGRHCIVIGQVGLSGGSTLEDFVVLGARAGTNNHVTVGEGAQIAGTSIVNADVPPGARWGGSPAKPIKQWFREMIMVERLARGKPAGSAGNHDERDQRDE